MLPTVLLALAACCFGSISTLVVVATGAGASLSTVLALRYVIAAGVLLVPAIASMRAKGHGGHAVRVTTIGGGFQALIAAVSLSALRYVDVATLGFLFYTYPAWVAFFAAIRRTEPVDTARVIALLLSLAGIFAIVGTPGAQLHPVGMGLALSAAVLYAIFIPIIGRIQGPLRPEHATAWVSLGAFVLFATAALVRNELTLTLPLRAWGAVVVLGLVCTVLAFVLFLRGLSALGPVRTAIVSTIEPFFTAVLAAIALAQPLAPRTLLGGALIATAVIILQAWRTPAREGSIKS